MADFISNDNTPAVTAKCTGGGNDGIGVKGESQNSNGVFGLSHHPRNAAISAVNDAGGPAIFAASEGTGAGIGVSGHSVNNAGVRGESQTNNGVLGISHSPTVAAVSAVNDKGGIGLFSAGGIAGHFEGDVEVTGDIRLVNAADCAEDFDISQGQGVEPGTVMVLGEQGTLEPSQRAYDKRVAGVISGAGGFKPGIILDKQQFRDSRMPVALLGKVYCKVDAQYAPVEVGDLLTTSPTMGHAMKAEDPLKAFGSVIGKALRPLQEGLGLVPILIALQ
jgi:hypothetical protein